jgi:hypothetical protein
MAANLLATNCRYFIARVAGPAYSLPSGAVHRTRHSRVAPPRTARRVHAPRLLVLTVARVRHVLRWSRCCTTTFVAPFAGRTSPHNVSLPVVDC